MNDFNKEVKTALKNIHEVMLLKYELKLSALRYEMGERLMHKQEVIDYLKISLRTYYRYKNQGLLVPIKIGESDYYYESDLQHIMIAQR